MPEGTKKYTDKVVTFYEERLKDYRHKSKFDGIVNVFWVGPDDYDWRYVTQVCTTPNISIAPEEGHDLMPEAKSVLEIGYVPKK